MNVQNRRNEKKDCFRAPGRRQAERGASMLELAMILPILVVLVYGIVDFGRLIHARLVVTNVSREGGSLASRDIREGDALIAMLQSSAAPFDLKDADGRIYITKIKAGATTQNPEPYIDSRFQGGGLNAASSITGSVFGTPHGLSSMLYNHLRYIAQNSTSDISEVTVVEVFYLYRPITPLPKLIQNHFLPSGGLLIGSRAVF
ncbi:MAG TPA: TadE/TadG family type IV pilus assembly protein [Syntrophales bacterium]|nr:TadE/TadG family type IV pilus assembly protein [Syntrophales bacterium]